MIQLTVEELALAGRHLKVIKDSLNLQECAQDEEVIVGGVPFPISAHEIRAKLDERIRAARQGLTDLGIDLTEAP